MKRLSVLLLVGIALFVLPAVMGCSHKSVGAKTGGPVVPMPPANPNSLPSFPGANTSAPSTGANSSQ